MIITFLLTYHLQFPTSLSFDEAATLPAAVSTAAIGLYAPKIAQGGAALTAPWKEGGRGKYTDEPLLVLGGSSAVGQAGELFGLGTT